MTEDGRMQLQSVYDQLLVYGSMYRVLKLGRLAMNKSRVKVYIKTVGSSELHSIAGNSHESGAQYRASVNSVM